MPLLGWVLGNGPPTPSGRPKMLVGASVNASHPSAPVHLLPAHFCGNDTILR